MPAESPLASLRKDHHWLLEQHQLLAIHLAISLAVGRIIWFAHHQDNDTLAMLTVTAGPTTRKMLVDGAAVSVVQAVDIVSRLIRLAFWKR